MFTISIYDPNGRRVFYRHGLAPTHWRMWAYDPPAKPDSVGDYLVGVYRTAYGPHPTRFSSFSTHVRNC